MLHGFWAHGAGVCQHLGGGLGGVGGGCWLDPIEPHGVCLRTLLVQLTRAPQPFQDPYSNASVRKAVLDHGGEVPGLNTAAQVGVL